MMNIYKIIFILVFLLSNLWEIFLYNLNLKYSLKQNKIPDIFKDTINEEEFKKSKNYLKDKTKFVITELIIKTIITLTGLIYLFPLFENKAHEMVSSPNNKFIIFTKDLTQILIFVLFLGVLYFLSDLPFDIMNTFYLEKKYGFSKITIKTYVLDKIKTIILIFILGFFLLLGFYKIVFTFKYWFIILSIFIIVVIFLINIIYPSFILPLFYKFEKLKDENLRKRIEDIVKKVNLKFENIYVINASSRSLHTNAFFSGIGKVKKIVFYDTLINNHTEDEIISVFAHELGHYKKGHIVKSFFLSSITVFVFIFLINFLKNSTFINSLYNNTFAISLPFVYSIIFIFSFSNIVELITNTISRKFESESDRYAVELTNKEGMIESLKKLVKVNLSNLTPHPLYSKFKYTHPPPVERIEMVLKINKP
ncbi:MAG: M48 family metallopeptidase [Caldisericia bacterium]